VKRKPRKPRSTLSPLIVAITEATYAQKFSELKLQAQQHCLASDDTQMIAGKCGFLLFVTLRALEIDGYVIEDDDVIQALALMGSVLGDLNELGTIKDGQREELVLGMDYLDALVQALSKKSVAVAWYQIDTAAMGGDIGTHELDRLLQRLERKRDGS
jgi:hypothetical protein